MKKLLVVLMVLSMATIANAGLQIVGAPTGNMNPSDTALISIVGDGQFASPYFAAYLVVQGPGTVAGGTLVYNFPLSEYGLVTADDTYVPWMQGIFNDPSIQQVGYIFFADTTMPAHDITGVIIGDILFHCDAPGAVVLSLVTMDAEGAFIETLWDTKVITQIPEPMTLGLLGLGGLFLRRRK